MSIWTIIRWIFGIRKYAKICENFAIVGWGVLWKSTWFLGGFVKKPCWSTMGEGVKNGRKSVHMVYGCPLFRTWPWYKKTHSAVCCKIITVFSKLYQFLENTVIDFPPESTCIWKLHVVLIPWKAFTMQSTDSLIKQFYIIATRWPIIEIVDYRYAEF